MLAFSELGYFAPAGATRGLFRKAPWTRNLFNPPQLVLALAYSRKLALQISFDKLPIERYSYKENKIRGFIHGALYSSAKGIHPAKLPPND